MVLLLSLLRVTTVVTLSVISYFHVPVVHLSFRLNENDGEYQLKRIISLIALLDNKA